MLQNSTKANLVSDNRLIVAAAAYFEAQDVLKALEVMGIPVTFIEVGIGAIKSARIASRTVGLVSSRSVIFIGSCGTSNEFVEPELINATSVAWAPADVRRSESYLVPGAEPEISLQPLPSKIDIKQARISCSSSISLRVEPKSNVFENLELFSVASAWSEHCSSFYAVLGITNQLGPDAHAQWKRNFMRIATMTANLIEENIGVFASAKGNSVHGT